MKTPILNFISNRNRDNLNLILLLCTLKCLVAKEAKTINVLKVKEMNKFLFAGKVKIADLECLLGRSKGWMWKGEKVNIHRLEDFLVWYLFNQK